MAKSTRKIGILLFLLVLSLPTFAVQKLTTTQIRENTIRINALEIDAMDITKIAAPKQMTIVLDDRALNFDFDKSIVKEQYFEMLNNLKNFIVENNYELTIVGYTDSKGSEQYNIGLSLRRAQAVKDKLVEFGLEPDRIVELVPMGEADPVATNDTPEGRLLNRRVEFKLVQRAN